MKTRFITIDANNNELRIDDRVTVKIKDPYALKKIIPSLLEELEIQFVAVDYIDEDSITGIYES
jgi:hypothetical protein